MEGTYTVSVVCHNCDYRGTLTLPKGQEFGIYNLRGDNNCPTCGCNTLVKSSRGPKWRDDNIMLCLNHDKTDKQLSLTRG